MFIITDKARAKGEYINRGVGVMRDYKLKLEDLKPCTNVERGTVC